MKLERLRNLREDSDKTQSDLAEFLHMTQNAYSQYETGARTPSIECIIKISDFYGVSVDYLLGLTDNPQRNK